MYKRMGKNIIIRKPALPFKEYLSTLDNVMNIEGVYKLFSEPFIQKAIYLASESLFFSLKNKKGDMNKIIESFHKYYTRMSTRSTPFGLLALTQINQTNLNQLKITLRIDKGWYTKLLRKLLDDIDILGTVSVKFNDSVLIDGIYLKNHYSFNEFENTYQIEVNNLIEYIYSVCCGDFVEVNFLYNSLIDSIPELDRQLVSKFILTLIDKDYLLTNLDFSVGTNLTDSTNEFITRLIDHLTTYKNLDYVSKLNIIKNKIDKINTNFSSIHVEDLIKLKNRMKNIVENQVYFDAILTNIGDEDATVHLTQSAIGENLLDYLSRKSLLFQNTTRYQDYLKAFIEEYSLGSRVSLLDMLDSENGIGYPSDEIQNGYHTEDELVNLINQNLINKLIAGEDLLDIREILDNIPDRFNTKLNVKTLPPSVELFFMNFPTSDEKYNYLAPAMISRGVGNTIGRFYSALDQIGKSAIKEDYDNLNLKLTDKNILPVMLISQVNHSQLLNLLPQESHTPYVLPINIHVKNDDSTSVLDIKDITVELDNNRNFVFRDEKSNKELLFLSYTNLNTRYCHKVYRFLLNPPHKSDPFKALGVILDKLSMLKKQPRVIYKNLVIKPKSLIVTNKDFDGDRIDPEIIKNYFDSNFVYLVENDNRLLIDLKNTMQLNLLKKEILKKGKFEITELEQPLLDALNEKDDSFLTQEVVIPYQSEYIMPSAVSTYHNFSNISKLKRNFLPLSKWIYLKINIVPEKQETFLTEYLLLFIKLLKNEDLLELFHFIRYEDNNLPSIRLRLKTTKSKKLLIERIENFLNKLYENNLIVDVSINTYRREAERYGGIKNIEKAEAYFMGDSLSVIHLLKNKSKINIFNYACVLIVKLLEEFGFSYDQKLLLLSIHKDTTTSQYYRTNKTELISLYRDENNIIFNELHRLFNKFGEEYIQTLLIDEDITEEYLQLIVSSCIHMFCNRLFSLGDGLEGKVLSVAEKLIQSIYYMFELD